MDNLTLLSNSFTSFRTGEFSTLKDTANTGSHHVKHIVEAS